MKETKLEEARKCIGVYQKKINGLGKRVKYLQLLLFVQKEQVRRDTTFKSLLKEKFPKINKKLVEHCKKEKLNVVSLKSFKEKLIKSWLNGGNNEKKNIRNL